MKTKLPLLLLALVSAILVWLYDVIVVNPNDVSTFTQIPVTFENEDEMHTRDLMLTEGGNDTVTLRISGRRSELKKLSRNNIQVTVDLSQIEEAGRHELTYSVAYPVNVSTGDLSIDNRSPAYVTVAVDHYIRRAVEVRAVFEGEAPTAKDGEFLAINTDAMEITPAEVTVTGPAELVESIDCARIVINTADVTKTIQAEYDYVLLDAAGETVARDELVTDCEKLAVSIPVLKYKDVPLVLKTQPGGGATEENITYTLSTDAIRISGEPAVVDRINQIELGTLDFATITGPITKAYPVTLPEDVNNDSGLTEVEVSARVSGLNVITMSIPDFSLINVPEGLHAEALDETAKLTLRGAPEAISSLAPEDVIVSVDLSSFTQAGTYIIPVSVQLPEGLQVGAIGSNTLTVTLS